MRWRGGRRSMFIDDRRGRTAKRAAGGIGGIVLIGAIVIALLGGDPTVLLDAVEQGGTITTTERVPTPAEDEQAEFVSVVLADTEDTWHALFQQAGEQYQEPTLTLFSGAVDSACGFNTAATGPFYCPGDQRVYLDLEFFQQLESLGAPGDFARAYVIGHEVGHHVQNLTGVLGAVQREQSASPGSANALQVRVELQADCYAGVWAHHADRQRDLLEAGDVEEGLQAAAAIGDDTLQRRAGRAVRPESFTHGSAAQRAQWFRTGFSSGDVAACDTFGGAG
ncbi:MAG TPA: neutral zinc metallopeptidase [Pseudomonadales bacterium]